MSENKKNKRKRRVLAVACIFAALIVAGSTFAWFTSKDEVTNRLTATADYGVTIVEDFTPPEEWLPGTEIKKNVSAVNTGNVEAFVRTALLNDAVLNVKGAGVAIPTTAADASTATKTTWVELRKTAADDNTSDGGNAVANSANEVTTLQAGGTLVYAAGTVVTPSDNQNVQSGNGTSADYSTGYKPQKTGLYIFKRTVYEGDGSATTKYSGYYYVTKETNGADESDENAGKGTFYALETEPGTAYIANIDSDAVQEDADGVVTLKTDALKDIKIATTKNVTISNTDSTPAFTVKWMKDNATEAQSDKSDATIIRLTYAGDITTGDNPTIDDVIIDINLDDDWTDNWTFKSASNGKVDGTNDIGYFFYNKILAPGATTEKLVKSVTLNGDVTQEAFNTMTYDLTVVLDSIQITPDEAKSNDSVVVGVNDATWGATASYDGTDVTWS